MSINKFQSIFDPTTNELDNVGSYLKASDGTLLTHTDVGGKKALDVNVAAGINVEVDLSHLDDSVRLGNGTDFFTSTSENGDIALDVHISNTSLVVTATNLDIRDLTHVSDSVKVGDGTDFLAVETDGSINVNSKKVGMSSLAHSAVSVTTTETQLVASPLSGRKSILIQNLGNANVYLGLTGLTTADSVLLPKGASVEFEYGVGIDLYAITSSGTADVRIFEAA
jgi:hypothetical protein